MTITLKSDGLFLRLLYAVPLARTRDRDRAERSRFTWRQVVEGDYMLTPLGVLNALIGLEVRVR